MNEMKLSRAINKKKYKKKPVWARDFFSFLGDFEAKYLA